MTNTTTPEDKKMSDENPDMSKITAVVLAGGKGARLRPLTAVFPKPLVPLGNRPVLDILLCRLRDLGFKKVVLCVGYLAELIQAVCGDGKKYGLEIVYSHEESPLGTAGPLGFIKDLSDPCIIMNGDLLTTLNFRKMVQCHIDSGSDMTLGLYEREVKIDFGVIQKDNDGEFTGYLEKPTYNYQVSMGVNVLGRKAIGMIMPGEYLDLPDLTLKLHKSGNHIQCFQEDCFWLDIGRMDDYALAQDEFEKNEAQFFSV